MLTDLVKVADDITAKIYVILWICIGAFIFRNIFAGIMGKHVLCHTPLITNIRMLQI